MEECNKSYGANNHTSLLSHAQSQFGRYGTLEHFTQSSNAIIRGRRLFEIFPSKGGDYSREAINQGTAIIRGNTVF